MTYRLFPVLLASLLMLVLGRWAVTAATQAAVPTANGAILLDDFEIVTDWKNLAAETGNVKRGMGAGYWGNHTATSYISKTFSTPLNLTDTQQIGFWMYSAVANGAGINLIFDSNNVTDTTGWDYYTYEFFIDWTGWRYVTIPRDEFTSARVPLGWDHINYMRFSASGWGNNPLTDTVLILDDMHAGVGAIADVDTATTHTPHTFIYSYTVTLQDRAATSRTLTLELVPLEASNPFTTTLLTPTVTLAMSDTAQAIVQTIVPLSNPDLEIHAVQVIVRNGLDVVDSIVLRAGVPLDARPHPRVLLNSADFSRINDWITNYSWATAVRDEIIHSANTWETRYNTRFHLTAWELPPAGGQWSQYYVCPDGRPLHHNGPTEHYCVSNGQIYSGWPYDEVIYTRMFDDLAEAVRDLALAYQLTGNAAYATTTTELLQAVAAVYETYPYHNRFHTSARNGGRILSQTLDEARWGYEIAWGYDLIANTLTASQTYQIENDLLRPLATTILRNGMRESNWQSWHNAAVGAIGFAIDEPVLIYEAFHNSENGVYFQLANSVLADGFWYEGAWGYHFFALEPIQLLGEMGLRAEIDLYQEAAMRNLFTAPLMVVQPDNRLPALNDSNIGVTLAGHSPLYEGAFRYYGDSAYAAPIDSNRGRNGLFWGAEIVTPTASLTPTSVLLPAAGLAIARNHDHPQHPMYVAFDFGPHGGGHGHYDKLGYILYGRNKLHGVDPGTISYAADSHTTWDTATAAHNTITIDEQNQDAATGQLHQFHTLPGLTMMQADAGEAYTHTTLLRTLLVAGDYMVDQVNVSSDQVRQIDWTHHDYGSHLSPTLPTTRYDAFPNDANGYHHFKNAAAFTTTTGWQAAIDASTNLSGTSYGSTWVSEETTTVNYRYDSRDGGVGALHYDFTDSGGYALFTTETISQINEVPNAVRLKMRGDGSQTVLTVRVLDSGGERYYKTVGPISDSWHTIPLAGISGWAHHSGDRNHQFDPPASVVSIQINHADVQSGTLYVDDIELLYTEAGTHTVETFNIDRGGLVVHGVGGTETTVVMGDGLTPERIDPMSFVMQRRTAQTTTFLTVLEPITETGQLQQVVTTTTDAPQPTVALHIRHTQYADQLFATQQLTPTAAIYQFGPATCDGSLCAIRRATDTGQLMRLVLANGTQLTENGRRLLSANGSQRTATNAISIQIDYLDGGTTVAIRADDPHTATLKLYAPAATTVTLNGAAHSFCRSGDDLYLTACVSAIGLQTIGAEPAGRLWALWLMITLMMLTLLYTRRSD